MPESGFSRPIIRRNKVVFPVPDGAIRQQISGDAIFMLTPERTGREPYDL